MKHLLTISSLVFGLQFCHTGLAASADHESAQAGASRSPSAEPGAPVSGLPLAQNNSKDQQEEQRATRSQKEENPEDDCE